jgi:phenylacetic acid degradation operon negative regulatory protein
VPHGGSVWLGTLVRWLEPFGITERNTRTATTRLVNEGWLDRSLHGRKSELALAEAGRHRTREADHRIYTAAPSPWKGTWSLVLLGHCGLPSASRDRIRRELRLLGFGELSPETFAHPAADLDELEWVLAENGVGEGAVVLAAGDHPGWSPGTQARSWADRLDLVASGWDLTGLSQQYAAFIEWMSPIAQSLGACPEPELAFRARVLSIHEYRRIVLRDPQLPTELLPAGWEGATARSQLAKLYAATRAASTLWIEQTGACSSGPLGHSSAAFRDRFVQSGD